MPWSIGDVEKHCKGLTDKQKKVWVSVANKALAACQKKGGTDCEKSAIMQANSVAKKTKAEQADLYLEFFDCVREEDIYNYLNVPLEFKEGETVSVGRIWEEDFGLDVTEVFSNHESKKVEEDGSDDDKIMTVTFIKSGWSKNQNYWSPEIVKELASRLVKEAHTQYLNHLKGNRVSRGRDVEDMASRALEAWTEEKDGITLGKAKVLVVPEDHKNKVIFSLAKKNFIFGPSVDVWAKASKGKKEGIEGTLIDKIAVFFAFDYVDRVGAGGEITSIGEAEVVDTTEESYLEKFPKFSNFIDYTYNKYKFNDYHQFLQSYLWMVMNDAEIKDKKKACKKAIYEYADLLSELDYFSFFNMEGQESDTEELKLKNIEFSDINWGKVIVPKLNKTAFLIAKTDKRENWHLPYKDHTGKVNKEALSALRKLIEIEKYRGIKLDFEIPSVIKAKILQLSYLAGIQKGSEKEVENYIKRWLYDVPVKGIA